MDNLHSENNNDLKQLKKEEEDIKEFEALNTKILYDDDSIEINDNGELFIKKFFYPIVLRKKVDIKDIQNIEKIELNWGNGKYRYMGMGLNFIYYHLDRKRPFKDNALILDVKGSIIKYGLTPNDPDQVLIIIQNLMEKCKRQGQTHELKSLIDKKNE